MDILDKADEAQEAFMRAAMSRVGTPLQVKGIGMCLNCGAGVDGEKRWCDAACRDDHEAAQRNQRQRVVNKVALESAE